MKKSILSALILLLLAIIPVSAEIRQVPGEYSTIQAAINDCINGDMVRHVVD